MKVDTAIAQIVGGTAAGLVGGFLGFGLLKASLTAAVAVIVTKTIYEQSIIKLEEQLRHEALIQYAEELPF
jgi:hypothetical protein